MAAPEIRKERSPVHDPADDGVAALASVPVLDERLDKNAPPIWLGSSSSNGALEPRPTEVCSPEEPSPDDVDLLAAVRTDIADHERRSIPREPEPPRVAQTTGNDLRFCVRLPDT